MYLYLHVPFCQSHCIYCDFYVVLEKHGGKQAYVEAVIREIHERFSGMWADSVSVPLTALNGIYVGGGTPSLLSASEYQRIFDVLSDYVNIAPDAEITLETNPGQYADPFDKTSQDALSAYLDVGFNRISVGAQSFQDDELKRLSRKHSAAEAESIIQALDRAGFENISLDLMYGIPGQTQASWQDTLNRAVFLPVQHISMYGLKVEKTTPLHQLSQLAEQSVAEKPSADKPGKQAAPRYLLPDDDTTVDMYFAALEFMRQQGFNRYEFSNFARPGYQSRHNLNYWENGEYFALGPSAHGYVDDIRYENVRDLQAYLENPLAGSQRACPPNEQLENAIIFGLRKTDGIDIPGLERTYNLNFRRQFGWVIEKYGSDGFFEFTNNRLRLTDKAIPVSNTLLAEFISC